MLAAESHRLVSLIERTLHQQSLDFRREIELFGQVRAAERRTQGIEFKLSDHIRGLILSLMSNQRRWGPIAQNLSKIDEIFFHYDVERIKNANPNQFVEALLAIRCGNRRIANQMTALRMNIDVFERIMQDYGSLDIFVNSANPDEIAKQVSAPEGRYKLREVGFTLALEYLRNVGVRASKPDLHVRRAISAERLGLVEGFPTEQHAYDVMLRLADEAGVNPTYLDNLLWLFCAKDYGNVCGAIPNCSICSLAGLCNYPRSPAGRVQ